MSAASPLVSILMPVRNGGSYLNMALRSLLEQTYENIEIMVVDDHSTDDSLRRLKGQDRRVHMLSNQGRGIVSALNTAAEHANGDILARMDADDIALPMRIEAQVNLLLARPDVEITGTKVEIFSDDGEVAGGFRAYADWINSLTEPEDIAREIFVESPIPHPSALLWRHTFDQLGGYRESEWPEDYDLWLRAYALGKRMAKPESILLRWRDSATRLSRTSDRYSGERFLQAKARFLTDTVLHTRAVQIWGAGPTGRALCDWLTQHGVDVNGFIDVHPRRIGGKKRGRPVRAPDYVRAMDEEIVLVAVGARGVRDEIRGFMGACDKQEGADYLFVA